MAKEHSHHYYFAGSGCKNGTMICSHCQKPVDTMKHDWVSSVKPLPHDDWGYRSRHRWCVENQDGWVKIETAKADFKAKVDEVISLLKGYDENVIYAAMVSMEIIEEE